MTFGETPREEELPVPEGRPATPEEVANIMFDGKDKKIETLEPKPFEESKEVRVEKFDFEAEQAKIEARYTERKDKLNELLNQASNGRAIEFLNKVSKLKEDDATKKRYPTSEWGKKEFSGDEQRILDLGLKIEAKSAEIEKEKKDALAVLEQEKLSRGSISHADIMGDIDKI